MSFVPEGFEKNPKLHAYLFVSASAQERHNSGMMLAKAMMCRNAKDNGDPCGKCDCCIKMDAMTHPDCIIIPAAKKISVKDLRKILSEAYISTNEADFKVYILEDVDEFNEQSQNALLKVIEEPPAHVKFVLTASSYGAVLPTVRSRSLRLNGTTKPLRGIAEEIRKTKSGLDEEQIKTLSYFVEGYDKVDISLLKTEKIMEYVSKAHLFLSGKDTGVLMSLPATGEDLMQCLQVFMLCVKQIAVAKAQGRLTEGILSEALLSECNPRISMKKAHTLYDLFEECYIYLQDKANVNAILGYLREGVK